MQLLKTFVSEDQSIVDIPNVTDEQVVIAVKDALKLMGQTCSLMETTIRHSAGDKGLPTGLPRRSRTHRSTQSESLHVQSRFDESPYGFI